MPRDKGRFIAVFGGKGGTGKTALSLNLAVSLVQIETRDILLLDMTPRETCAMPGSARSADAVRSPSFPGTTTCSVPGAPGPNAACTCLYPAREPSDAGTTLIEGIPVLSPMAGSASATRTTSAEIPNSQGRRQRRSAQRSKEGDRCSRSRIGKVGG